MQLLSIDIAMSWAEIVVWYKEHSGIGESKFYF